MSRRTRAGLDAALAVLLTIAIMVALHLFTTTLSTPFLRGGRAWWILGWGALILVTALLLAKRSTSIRHLACVGATLAAAGAHLLGYWLGLVPADAPTRSLVLTDFVFIGAATFSLTVVNIRRREYREIDVG